MRRMKKITVCECCGKTGTYAKGLCKSCYMRNLRNGTPQKKLNPNKERNDEIIEMRRNGASFEKIGKHFGISKQAAYMVFYNWYKPTNGDRIRSMTDDELANMLSQPFPYNCAKQKCSLQWKTCKECALDWLKQECEA